MSGRAGADVASDEIRPFREPARSNDFREFHRLKFSQKLNNWLKKLNTGLRLERNDGFSSALICWTTWSRTASIFANRSR